MRFLLLLLLAASTRVELVDEVYTIPRAEWRYVEVVLKQTPVAVHCDFATASKGAGVRVALLTRADLDRLRADRAHGFITATPIEASGSFSYPLRTPGEYAVVVDNRGLAEPVRVHLRVSLDFMGKPGQGVGYLSPQRRLAVIVISFAVFFAIVTWSARKLLRSLRG